MLFVVAFVVELYGLKIHWLHKVRSLLLHEMDVFVTLVKVERKVSIKLNN